MEEKLTEEEKLQEEEYERLKNEIREQVKAKGIEKMTAPELREIAMKIPGVQGAHAMDKEKLIEIIKDFLEIKEEKKPKAGKEKIREIKQKIRQLKKQKEEALKNKDKKQVQILRRRINRLKKLTRKLARAA
jgi:preprotein translocase subunit SecD